VTLAAIALLASCKPPRPDNGRILSGALGDSADFLEMTLKIQWQSSSGNSSDLGTTFEVTDGSGKSYKVSPAHANFIAKIGTVSSSLENDEFISLGQSDGLRFPTLDLDMTLADSSGKRTHWCHTQEPAQLGKSGKIRCYRPESPKGKFVTDCFASASNLRVKIDVLECENDLSPMAEKDSYLFKFLEPNPNANVTLAALLNFRKLQGFCKEVGNPVPGDPRNCSCKPQGTTATGVIDLWQEATRFLKDSQPADSTAAFLQICSRGPVVPTTAAGNGGLSLTRTAEPTPAPTNWTPEQSASQMVAFQQRVAVCNKLKALGLSGGFNAQNNECLCDHLIAPFRARNVDLTKYSYDGFLEQCFALDRISHNGKLCSVLGMTFFPESGKKSLSRTTETAQNGTCKQASSATGSNTGSCLIYFDRIPSKFIDSCLKLTPAPPKVLPKTDSLFQNDRPIKIPVNSGEPTR
jgi:hypothetical protein